MGYPVTSTPSSTRTSANKDELLSIFTNLVSQITNIVIIIGLRIAILSLYIIYVGTGPPNHGT